MRTLCIALLLTIGFTPTTDAQSRTASNSERAARASWKPRRPAGNSQRPLTNSTRPVKHSQVRLVPVDHHDEAIQDAEVLPPPVSVMEGSVIEEIPMEEIYDGQIIYGPIHDSTVSCDALPTDACGCGSVVCDTCTPSGCDSGCASGSCGSRWSMGDCSMCGELCSPRAWRPCITLCVPMDGWATFEALTWWQDGMSLPPLISTSSDPNVARTAAGVIGQPTTQILYGGDRVLDDSFTGGRLRFGIWLDRRHTWGVGAEYFGLGNESETFSATSSGNPILARPFFNTLTGLEDSNLVAFPGIINGTVTAQVSSKLSGAAVSIRHLRCCDEGCRKWLFCGVPDHYCGRTEFTMGYRFLQLDEGVRVTESSVSSDPANPGSFEILDQFDTRNQFNGFDIGWTYRRTRGYWTFDTLCRLGIGNTRQTATVRGQTTINDPANQPPTTHTGGLLAQTSNIGTYQQNEFAVVPEFNANVGYQLTDHVKLSFGYTFIYWSNVIRPGHHISRDLNPNLLPPPANPLTGTLRPEFAFDTTDYWVQGINFGGEYRW